VNSSAKGGLVLSGGGARGAYQAGVLKALATIHAQNPEINPFRIISGTSSGAVNSAFLASAAGDFMTGTERLCNLWETITPDRIYRVGGTSLFLNAMRVVRTLLMSGKGRSALSGRQVSLLDTSPAKELFSSQIDFEMIQKNVELGHLDALALTAMDYASSFSVNFVEAKPGTPLWERTDRFGVSAHLRVEHVMASSAIPIFFPAAKIGERFYGDGCLRNRAPLSPAIRLGADRLVIIGVRKGFADRPDLNVAGKEPGIGKILNTVINSVLLDGIEMDLERLSRINNTVSRLPDAQANGVDLRPIHYVYIKPSRDIAEIAKSERSRLPRSIKYLLSGLGNAEETADIVSYLLFEGTYCRRLIDLGFQDGMARRDELAEIFTKP
jgi:NTE family protein